MKYFKNQHSLIHNIKSGKHCGTFDNQAGNPMIGIRIQPKTRADNLGGPNSQQNPVKPAANTWNNVNIGIDADFNANVGDYFPATDESDLPITNNFININYSGSLNKFNSCK